MQLNDHYHLVQCSAEQKILKRSGVHPSDHMDNSGVASVCNLDTRLHTLTWMGCNFCVCLCAYAFTCVIMCACWLHVSMCQGTLAPADEEIKLESPPVVTSCPSTLGVFVTSLSYWLLVIAQCPESDLKYRSLCVCLSVYLWQGHSH